MTVRAPANPSPAPAQREPKPAPKVGFVSLGCPKALVDSERIITKLRAEGYQVAPDYAGADVVVVNTCGFLDSAKQESLDAIGEAIAENGRVIVTGCMGVEEGRIREVHPGVLAVTGPHQYEQVVTAVHDAVPPLHDPYVDLVPPEGLRLTPRHYAYLKISEGCNNRCSFCIIPSIRGDLASRPASHVMAEAERLVKAGVKELLVISQDTSAYGLDIKYAESQWKGAPLKAKFLDLSRALGELGVWTRMHYVYPYPHVDEVIPLMAEGKILPYLDIPFQHASPAVLKAMRRPAHQEKTAERIANWRKVCPDLAVRSTFIVGFPGETEEDFSFLLDWLREAKLNRVGCFKYEAVSGAKANELQGAVPEEVKEERWHRFMAAQREVSEEILATRVGTTIDVIIDEIDEEGATGRSKWDAPEIDGSVFLNGEQNLKPGDIVQAHIDEADDYDLWGTVVRNG
ncbi:MAG: 30S ribosomal protein S12 methylthiotransferase RimO [Hyphomicrobium zavarzinii]|uniref:30S ribosomal protein S12 methylthiotransferase RimO n=1 Tax=Hyphomicrobium zavarzinii TaxID=48292 RepID=UPI001A394E49|nr:30S ribosomal protein S12 methylthiotransferase RimO [Hyphomicrobium zavarzinii]MBL8845693.1 30S ribosomal protein S12 methylthiotransferase RimO [Hyphomicrobium zavarzinii]HML42542.1 30S ribosomal protein S12 methylthiotransferase RimO [Hyphomicrobium zavarzinii]